VNLRRLFCRHTHTTRERDREGRLWLVCHPCGYATLALCRSASEWSRVKSGEASGQRTATVKPKKVRTRKAKLADVTPIRRQA
jgi:hypothetical protein